MNGGFESDRLRKRKEGGEMRVYMNETNEWMKRRRKKKEEFMRALKKKKKKRGIFKRISLFPIFKI